MQHDNLCHEPDGRLGGESGIYEHHALADLPPLHLLERQRHRLPRARPGDGEGFVHDALELHWHEGPVGVRAQDQVRFERHPPAHQRPAHHRPNPRHRECVVDVELRRLVAFLAVFVLLGGNEVEPEVEERQVLASSVAHLEDRGNPGTVSHCLRRRDDVSLVLHEEGDATDARGLDDAYQFVESVLQHVLGTHVDLRDDEEGSTLEGKRNTKVLSSHTLHAHVCSDHHHGVVWDRARHAVNCCLDVLFVPREIHERNHLRAFADDLWGGLRMERGVVDQAALCVEPDHVVAHTAGTSSLRLMSVPKHLAPCQPATVVQFPASEHPDKRTLPAVNIAHHSDAHVDEVTFLRPSPNKDLGNPPPFGLSTLKKRHVAIAGFRHALHCLQRSHQLIITQSGTSTVVLDPNGIEGLSVALI
mmetsp:Transcript_28154/g.57671  ORF Transcript_28154/g.57671 Transcript_28154/m.57671 type:complete len:417 (-) Transcript_28154:358-1608(-)